MSLKVCSLVLSASPNWFYAARTMELQPGQIAVRPVNQEGGLHRFRSSWSRIFSFFINSKKLCFFFLLVNNKSQCSVDVSCSRLRFLGRETEAKTKTNFLKDPTYAIFSESRGFEDINHHILTSQRVNFLLVNQTRLDQTRPD